MRPEIGLGTCELDLEQQFDLNDIFRRVNTDMLENTSIHCDMIGQCVA